MRNSTPHNIITDLFEQRLMAEEKLWQDLKAFLDKKGQELQQIINHYEQK